MSVYLRSAELNDLNKIMSIIDDAKLLMKKDGNPQWQNGRPNAEILKNDINKGQAYCLVVNQEVAGIAVLQTAPELTYKQIAGHWHNDTDQYATIHRIALSSKFRGQHLGLIFISNLLSRGVALGINNFRIDTHAINKRMQGLIKTAGFVYCGIIHIDNTENGARFAYELNL